MIAADRWFCAVVSVLLATAFAMDPALGALCTAAAVATLAMMLVGSGMGERRADDADPARALARSEAAS